jgi:hypothetical protein
MRLAVERIGLSALGLDFETALRAQLMTPPPEKPAPKKKRALKKR